MLALTVFVTFGKAEIDNEYIITGALSSSNQEIVRLDISVDNTFLVNFLDTAHHLSSNEEHGLKIELSPACLEKIFEGGSEQVHDHHVEVLVGDGAIRSNVVKSWHAGCDKIQIELGVRVL